MGWATAAGALVGAIAGSQRQKQDVSSTSKVDVAPASAEELAATKNIQGTYGELQNLVGQGPGAQDVTAAVSSSRGLADLLSQYSQGNYQPTAADQSYAQSLLAPQQVAIQQTLRDQERAAARMGAISGRGPMDFASRVRLGAQAQDLNQQLGAQQSQLAAQQPFQRLNFASQLAQVRGNLATQAMANRQALMSMGQSIQGNERQFRLGTATRTTNQEQSSGGGLGGAISGAIGGMSMAGGLMNMFGGGSGGGGMGSNPFGIGTSSFNPTQGLSQIATPASSFLASPTKASNLGYMPGTLSGTAQGGGGTGFLGVGGLP